MVSATGTSATVHKGTPVMWNTDQRTSTEARLLYPKTVAATPTANPTRSELVSRKRCQMWLKFGTGRRLPGLPYGRHRLTSGGSDQGLGQYAGPRQERRVPARELDGLDPELEAGRLGGVRAGDRAILGAEDVSGGHGRPLPERSHLLGDPPELTPETPRRRLRHLRLAVVVEGLDRPFLRPGGTAVGV